MRKPVMDVYSVTFFEREVPDEAPAFVTMWQAKLYATLRCDTAVYIHHARYEAPAGRLVDWWYYVVMWLRGFRGGWCWLRAPGVTHPNA